jgi:hypothetical protein
MTTKTAKAEKILDRLDPNLLLNCYSTVTKLDKIHEHFTKMRFERKEDRIRIYNVYVSLMLPKCMKEKGYGSLSDWRGSTGGKLRTSGGNCAYGKKLIQIADWMIESDITKFEDLRETILHEIAHANAWLKHRENGHGSIWVREARLIGCTGDRCLPKKYCAVLYESAIYKCRHPDDKCICVKTGSKQALTIFSKKMPTLVCKKHRIQFDYIETKPYEVQAPEKTQKLEEFRKQHGLKGLYGFGTDDDPIDKEFVIVEDGDVIEVDEEGDVYSVEPEICLKYD